MAWPMLVVGESGDNRPVSSTRGNGMSELPEGSQSDIAVSGQAARRKFLHDAGTVAMLAPAAALLLAASNAKAQVRPPYNLDSDNTDDAPR